MSQNLSKIDEIVRKNPKPVISTKADGTPVTVLDVALSELVEGICTENFPQVVFYSEEKFSKWGFPLLALDPLDGTKEYIEGRDEWAISVGLFESDRFEGQGWIYNPITRECFHEGKPVPFRKAEIYRGEISHTEWKSGLFTTSITRAFSVKPVGSIAYKLGRLAAGKSSFVVSKRPKNIWDIAGGTLLCKSAGLRFYSRGREVTTVSELYEPPLIWCHEELFPELSSIFY